MPKTFNPEYIKRDGSGQPTIGYGHVSLTEAAQQGRISHLTGVIRALESATLSMNKQATFDVTCVECGGQCASDVAGTFWHVYETACTRLGKFHAWDVKHTERAA